MQDPDVAHIWSIEQQRCLCGTPNARTVIPPELVTVLDEGLVCGTCRDLFYEHPSQKGRSSE